MDTAGLTIVLFDAVEDGFLVALAGGRAAVRAAAHTIRALDPWQRRWLAAERAWWIADDAISLVARRVPEVAAALEAWVSQPYDIAEATARYATSTPHIRLRVHVPAEVARAYTALGLAPGAPAESVVAARRRLARQHHPDAGGDHRAMAAINHAADTVMGWLQRYAVAVP
jgi:hypothetical protein